MAKSDTIAQLASEHQELERVVDSLAWRQKTQEYIFGDWSVKDILVHIAAWQRKAIEEIDDLLKGQQPWIVGANIDAFNAQAVEEKKACIFAGVYWYWKTSWFDLLRKMEQVPDEKWDEPTNFIWPDGSPLTIGSLFNYEYEGANHEGGHAKQIREHFQNL